MDISEVKCRLCGDNIFQAAEHGAYLRRVNEYGVAPISECRPSCLTAGTPEDAIMRAITDGVEPT